MQKKGATREAKQAEKPAAVEFHYIKGNHFRVVHADGVWGGLTPKGQFQMTFFSERVPFPRTVTHELVPSDEPGQLAIGNEILRESRDGIVREVEVSVVMTLAEAEAVHEWVGRHLKRHKQDQAGAKPKAPSRAQERKAN